MVHGQKDVENLTSKLMTPPKPPGICAFAIAWSECEGSPG